MNRIPTADVNVTLTAPVTKLCPVKDETDTGTVTITYRTHGYAIEFHSLAAYLAEFTTRHLSHEDFTAQIAEATGGDVSSTWTTAGIEVTCAVLREPVRG